MNKSRRKNKINSKRRMSELCKNLNKFRKRYEGKWDQFEYGEITLRGIISVAMIKIILDEMGDKLRYTESEIKAFSIDWNKEVPLEGVLIYVIKEKNRFKVKIINTKDKIETYFIPEKKVKLESTWLL